MNDTNDQTSSSDPTRAIDQGDEHTEQIPRGEATQQLPTQDAGEDSSEDHAGRTETREPVDTAVFGTTTAHTAAATTAATAPDTTVAPEATTGTWPPPVPPRPTGPHAPAIILGLICVVVAGLVLAQELGNLSIDWGNVGPLGFVAVGAVLVVLGAVGLMSSNRRNARP